MKDKTLFILNPNSGNGRGEKLLPRLKSKFGKYNHSIEIIPTEYRNHAKNLVKALQYDFGKIIIVGGDGTLNEALNGFNEEFQGILGVIPAGSGNDFAKTARMTADFDLNVKIVQDDFILRSIDFGEILFYESNNVKVISRRFINSAGVGFDALVSDMKNKSSRLKGLPQYIVAVFKALKHYNSISIKLDFDNKTDSGDKLLIAISNGKTYGGGIKVNPFAEINDGYLDACIIDPMPVTKVIRNLHKFVRGTHSDLKEIKLLKFCNAELRIDEGAYIHTDGEVISSNATNIKLTVHPKKLKFLFNTNTSF